jgi:hypothetical protein
MVNLFVEIAAIEMRVYLRINILELPHKVDGLLLNSETVNVRHFLNKAI